MRQIGVLLNAGADDPESQTRLGAFLQALALLGWTIGRNVRIDTHWGTTNAAEIHKHAAELAALAPDVILANGAVTVGPLLQAISFSRNSTCTRRSPWRLRARWRRMRAAAGEMDSLSPTPLIINAPHHRCHRSDGPRPDFPRSLRSPFVPRCIGGPIGGPDHDFG
jgi:hypothetical protein